MADTHINAFYMNVDEKKQAVTQAQAELEEAERLLKSHPDYQELEEAKPSKTDSKKK